MRFFLKSREMTQKACMSYERDDDYISGMVKLLLGR